MSNLVLNAVKFSNAQDVIEISVGAEGDTADVRVRDTGIGIPASELPHVFDAFHQVRRDTPQRGHGLGLGLALVKSIVDLHDGEVSAHSDGPDLGSTFHVRFPLSSAQEDDSRARPVTPAKDGACLRVLVIEDEEDSGYALKVILEQRGHRVELAMDGADGLGRSKAFRPDVILCDICLPGDIDGYAVARAIRSTPESADTLLIALTGYGLPQDRQRSLDAGFNAHVTKPIDFEALSRVIAQGAES